MTIFTWFLALTLRATAVLVVALALGAFLRHAPVARHRLFTLAAIGLLLLPALPRLVPRWELQLVPQWMGKTEAPTPSPVYKPAPASESTPRAETGAPPRVTGPATVALADAQAPTIVARPVASPNAPALPFAIWTVSVWLIGVLASLVGLGRGLRREKHLLAASRPLGGTWLETLAEIRRSLAVHRTVRLLTSEEIQTPLTGGWLRPAVLLPSFATPWPEERQRVVLQHELVHVLRGDAVRHLAWRLVAALYWFHPLARLAGRQASASREEACDETVLRLGNRPSAYARHLLEIAESLSVEPPPPAIALPMIDRGQLERRLLLILDPNRAVSRGHRMLAGLSVAALAGMVLGAAAAAPRPGAASATVPTATATAVLSPPAAAVPSPAAATIPSPTAASVIAEPDDRACVEGIGGNFTFTGSFSEGPSGTDLNRTYDGDFALQQHLGDGLRLCARVHGPVRFDERDGSIVELPRGGWVQVETGEGRRTQRMLVTEEDGVPKHQWWLNGRSQPVDAAAHAWLGDALAAVKGFREIGSIQGQVGSLQGEIGSIQGEVGSLQGQIGSIQGQIGSLQGKLGSIQGERGSLQGAIGGHQGAIGGLQGSRGQADAAQRARIDREIESHRAAIKKLEAEMDARDFPALLAAAESELDTFDRGEARTRIADLERQIKDVRADERIAALERQIRDIHANERIEEIERRMKPVVERLKRQVGQLGG